LGCTSSGGGMPSFRKYVADSCCPVFMLAILSFLSALSSQAASEKSSSSMHSALRAIAPLFVPILALCFEREVDGSLRQYGLWPCLSSRPLGPGYGVFPALFLLSGSATAVFFNGGAMYASSPVGVFFSLSSGITFAIANVIVAVVTSQQSSLLASSGACVLTSLFMALAFGALSLAMGDASQAANLLQLQPAQAIPLYASLFFIFGLATFLRFTVIHLTSSLTATITFVLADATAQLLIDLTASSSWMSPVNALGVVGILVALILHVWYMEGRERIRWASESIPLNFDSAAGVQRYTTSKFNR